MTGTPRVLRVLPRMLPVVPCGICGRHLKATTRADGGTYTLRRHRGPDGEWCLSTSTGTSSPPSTELPTAPSRRRGLTVREASLIYVGGRLERREIRPKTATSYAEALAAFGESAGLRTPVTALTLEHVQRFQADQAEGKVSTETLRLRLKVVRMWTSWLVEEGLVKGDPCKRLRLPPKARSMPRGLKATEVGRVLAYAVDTREQLVLSLMAREGLRAVEVSKLDLGDIDPREETLLVREGKGGHSRLLPVTRETLDLVDRYVREERGFGAGRLVTARRPSLSVCDGGLIPETIVKMVGIAMKRAGVRESGHSLRHTAAYALVDAGARVQDVQEFLGHTDLSTTGIYTKRSRVDELRAFVGRTEYHLEMVGAPAPT